MATGKKPGARASKFARSMGTGSPQIREVPSEDETPAPEVAAPVAEAAPEPPRGAPAARKTSGRSGGAKGRGKQRPEKPVRITVDLDA
ncbi:MAG: hypothetical protein M3P49_06900, partial [Actinomycetota bacterium]|nr:hypothetical protein [Actinomycetota bacterium]